MEATMIPLSKIVVPDRYRRVVMNTDRNAGLETAFARSISEIGLRFPIVVKEDTSRYVLVDGFRRYRACGKLGHTSIRAYVVPKSDQRDLDVLRFQYNVQRQDLSPMDEATIVRSLVIDEEMGVKEVARALGKKPVSVQYYLRCLNMVECWQKLVNRGVLPISISQALTGLTPVGQRELYRQMISRKVPFTLLNVKDAVLRLDPVKSPHLFTRPKITASRRIDMPLEARRYRPKVNQIAEWRAMLEHYRHEMGRLQKEITLATPIIEKAVATKAVFEVLPERAQVAFTRFLKEG